jgi:hypothetical protein
MHEFGCKHLAPVMNAGTWKLPLQAKGTRNHSTSGSQESEKSSRPEEPEEAQGRVEGEVVDSQGKKLEDWFNSVKGTPTEKAQARLQYVKETFQNSNPTAVVRMLEKIIHHAHAEGDLKDQALNIVVFEAHTLCASVSQRMDYWDVALRHFEGAIRSVLAV